MDGDFRTEFVREPGALKHHPALVLNADYRPLSYYPLSLWPWQEAIKAAWLDRVDIVAGIRDPGEHAGALLGGSRFGDRHAVAWLEYRIEGQGLSLIHI